jgi:glutathione S-transferase
MTSPNPDRLHYVRIPNGRGGRAESVRMVYTLAAKPFTDVLWAPAEFRAAASKNPFRQVPFVETPTGEIIYQTLAIMHHAARGTPAWPEDPSALTQALSVALGAYDLYQSFGAFPATDAAAKQKFEERRAPQYFGALDEIYAAREFAAGSAPTFADCLVHAAVTWCVRRNDVCRELLARHSGLGAFVERFEAIGVIAEFMSRQARAREDDPSV